MSKLPVITALALGSSLATLLHPMVQDPVKHTSEGCIVDVQPLPLEEDGGAAAYELATYWHAIWDEAGDPIGIRVVLVPPTTKNGIEMANYSGDGAVTVKAFGNNYAEFKWNREEGRLELKLDSADDGVLDKTYRSDIASDGQPATGFYTKVDPVKVPTVVDLSSATPGGVTPKIRRVRIMVEFCGIKSGFVVQDAS